MYYLNIISVINGVEDVMQPYKFETAEDAEEAFNQVSKYKVYPKKNSGDCLVDLYADKQLINTFITDYESAVKINSYLDGNEKAVKIGSD